MASMMDRAKRADTQPQSRGELRWAAAGVVTAVMDAKASAAAALMVSAEALSAPVPVARVDEENTTADPVAVVVTVVVVMPVRVEAGLGSASPQETRWSNPDSNWSCHHVVAGNKPWLKWNWDPGRSWAFRKKAAAQGSFSHEKDASLPTDDSESWQ